MAWFRVDNRLVHGQVIEAWLPYLDAEKLVVVSDALAADHLQQQIMQLAIPGRIQVFFITLAEAKITHDALTAQGARFLFLLATCQDVLRLVEQGIPVPVLNVGNMHYGPGKKQICPHIAVTEEDTCCLNALKRQGTALDFRCVPNDMPIVEEL